MPRFLIDVVRHGGTKIGVVIADIDVGGIVAVDGDHGRLDVRRPAQFFAKLRSDKNQAKRSGSSFRADSLQPLC